MYKKDYRIAERIVIYLAERSIGKSIPMFSHKVNKPANLEKALKKIKNKLYILK